jgi:hypothetical protein
MRRVEESQVRAVSADLDGDQRAFAAATENLRVGGSESSKKTSQFVLNDQAAMAASINEKRKKPMPNPVSKVAVPQSTAHPAAEATSTYLRRKVKATAGAAVSMARSAFRVQFTGVGRLRTLQSRHVARSDRTPEFQRGGAPKSQLGDASAASLVIDIDKVDFLDGYTAANFWESSADGDAAELAGIPLKQAENNSSDAIASEVGVARARTKDELRAIEKIKNRLNDGLRKANKELSKCNLGGPADEYNREAIFGQDGSLGAHLERYSRLYNAMGKVGADGPWKYFELVESKLNEVALDMIYFDENAEDVFELGADYRAKRSAFAEAISEAKIFLDSLDNLDDKATAADLDKEADAHWEKIHSAFLEYQEILDPADADWVSEFEGTFEQRKKTLAIVDQFVTEFEESVDRMTAEPPRESPRTRSAATRF